VAFPAPCSSAPQRRLATRAEPQPPRPGCLFVVATPLGNPADASPRAVQTIQSAGLIAAEDTRVTKRLLRQLQTRAHAPDGGEVSPLPHVISCHEHNQAERVGVVTATLRQGADVALVSDAGTPLISDPGLRVVAAAHDSGFRVSPIPGPCAAIAALSVSGAAAPHGFCILGFLPRQGPERLRQLAYIASERQRPIVLYEAPHRVQRTLHDLVAACEPTVSLPQAPRAESEAVQPRKRRRMQGQSASQRRASWGAVTPVDGVPPPSNAGAETRNRGLAVVARAITVCRELTKTHEQVVRCPSISAALASLTEGAADSGSSDGSVREDGALPSIPCLGEFTLVLHAPDASFEEGTTDDTSETNGTALSEGKTGATLSVTSDSSEVFGRRDTHGREADDRLGVSHPIGDAGAAAQVSSSAHTIAEGVHLYYDLRARVPALRSSDAVARVSALTGCKRRSLYAAILEREAAAEVGRSGGEAVHGPPSTRLC
jgi:16S rRNA (cytidine(1402)-2'-O)-methyltransferase